MSTGIGFDLVAVGEVRQALAEHGERYLRRVYTELELSQSGRNPRRLAACFAAKEATVKALGCHDHPIAWHSIELASLADAPFPVVGLSGGAAALARERYVLRLDVTITHRHEFAAAIVTTKGGR